MEMKYDGGKIKMGILFEDFPLALLELGAVSTYGDLKYKRSSWRTVSDAEVRYHDAKSRHVVFAGLEDVDEESELYHLAHEAWNCLALLQLELEKQERRDYSRSFEKALKAKQEALEKS